MLAAVPVPLLFNVVTLMSLYFLLVGGLLALLTPSWPRCRRGRSRLEAVDPDDVFEIRQPGDELSHVVPSGELAPAEAIPVDGDEDLGSQLAESREDAGGPEVRARRAHARHHPLPDRGGARREPRQLTATPRGPAPGRPTRLHGRPRPQGAPWAAGWTTRKAA